MTVLPLGKRTLARKTTATVLLFSASENGRWVAHFYVQLDFEANPRLEEPARVEADGPDRAPDQRVGRAVQRRFRTTICERRPSPGKSGWPRSTTPPRARPILNEILPDAFAVVRNAARRLCGKTWLVSAINPITWNMVHFDVQLIGGMVLHSGRIAEMATGEGKTLVATLPLYLNALTGRGAHLVTVNDYLARRDAEWMGEFYRFLGLTCGCVQHDQSPDVRRAQYACDITYGINSELGFRLLCATTAWPPAASSRSSAVTCYAIVDEVDSILIDEARTPLIIAGPATVSTHQYDKFKPGIEQLVRKQTHALQPAGQRGEGRARRRQNRGRRRMLLFKAKLGQPRNKALLRLLEDPVNRRALDKAELSFPPGHAQGRPLFALKEELFFTIDERAQESDLVRASAGTSSTPTIPRRSYCPI